MRAQVFEKFESIQIINLPARTDRRQEMMLQLERFEMNDDKRLAFFPAISVDNPGPFINRGAHGCFLSHYTVLQQAAKQNCSLLIIEDDCDFLDAFSDYNLIPDVDVFYGGYSASDPSNLETSDIIGSHFMGFSSKAVKLAAEYFDEILKPEFSPDAQAAAQPGFDPAVKPPVDGAYVWFRRAHPELKTVFAMLTEQRASRTDIGDQRLFDRLPFVRDLAEAARRWKRRRK